MPALKQYNVSCYNQTTNQTIYHNQLTDAVDGQAAKRKADKVHEKALLKLPTDTVRRYEIVPVEEGTK